MQTILIVDDNRLNQLVAAGALKQLGYVVDNVDSGLKAVEACAQQRYDAVLMDVMMPGMDGFEAAARIRVTTRALSRGPIPIIGVSARAMEGDRENALASGLDDYLTKPLRLDEVRTCLEHWLGPRHTPREVASGVS
jgi:CheY-like chemotaxis protein